MKYESKDLVGKLKVKTGDFQKHGNLNEDAVPNFQFLKKMERKITGV